MKSVKEMIEKRAYQLFLERKGIHGYHIQDWFQAEKEILAELEKQPAYVAVKAPAKPKAAQAKAAARAKKPAAKKK